MSHTTQQGLSESKKYDQIKELHKHIARIRSNYQMQWKSSSEKQRQIGVAVYFIEQHSLRVGHKNDNPKTVGCCTLRVEHITLHEKKTNVTLHFLGKKEVPFKKQISVPMEVYENLLSFTNGKLLNEELFELINADDVNSYLGNFMEGLTAKVFRTYNANKAFYEYLKQSPEKGEIAFQKALLEAARVCNHQKNIKDPQITLNPTTTINNYIDFRIIVLYCKQYNLMITDLYKSDLSKFEWAIDEVANQPESNFQNYFP